MGMQFKGQILSVLRFRLLSCVLNDRSFLFENKIKKTGMLIN